MSRKVTSYSAAHKHLNLKRGNAQDHLCNCGSRAQDWAYKHEDPCPNERISPNGQRYSLDPDRYEPMCRQCHRIYDRSTNSNALKACCPEGHPYSGYNLIIEPRGNGRKARRCRICRDRRRKARRAATKRQAVCHG